LAENITVPSRLVNTPSACDYVLEDSVYVSSKLVVEPGVVVRAKQDASIVVDGGEFLAVGDAQNRIVFEGMNHLSGYWRGIRFNDGRESRIEYVDIKDAGQDTCAIWCDKAGLILDDVTVSLVHSSVSNSYVNGVVLNEDVVLSAFGNNRFYGNIWAGLRVNPVHVPLLDADSDYLGEGNPNGKPYIALLNSELVRGEERRWEERNAPYLIGGYLYVKGGSLTLEPNVEMVFEDEAWLTVQGNGVLRAVGTATAPIIFRGMVEEPGYWDGITFDGSPWEENRLEYVEIRHSGNVESLVNAWGAVRLEYDARVHISNSVIADNAKYGITCNDPDYNENTLELGPGNSFSNNASGDIDPDCGVSP